MHPNPLFRRALAPAIAMILVAVSLAFVPFGPRPAFAAQIGPLEITSVTVTPDPPGEVGNPLAPGDDVTYQLAYSCSAAIDDPCTGATITHAIPVFDDVYGGASALDWVSATNLAGHWSAPDLSVPGQVTWTALPSMVDGTSGTLAFTLRVPIGLVPPGEQELVAAATLTLGAESEPITLPDPVIGAGAFGATVEKTGPNTLVLGSTISDIATHTIRICPVVGGSLWPEYLVVDTLPPGAQVWNPENLPPYATHDAVSDPQTITWHLDPGPPPSPTTGCITLTYQVRYPNEPGVNEIGQVDERTEKVNTVEVEAFDLLGDSDGVIGTDTHTLTLVAPPTSWGRTKTTDGEYFVLDGDTVTYRLGASNTSHVEAPGFTTATISDALPAEFTLTEIRTGTWGDLGDGGTASVEVSTNDGGSWTQVATAPNQTILDADVPAVDFADVTDVQWVFTSPEATMVRNWSASQQRLVGVVSGPAETIVTNCMVFSASGTGVSNGPSSSCADVRIEDAQPHPRIRKRTPNPSTAPESSPFEPVPANHLLPGETIVYVVDVDNNSDATGDLVNPRVFDCVPSATHLTVDLGGITYGPGGTGTWVPQHGTGDADAGRAADCATSGGTYLQFELDTSLTPGQAAPTIRYPVTAAGWTESDALTTPPGLYQNTAVLVATGPPVIFHCVSGSLPGIPAVDGACSDSHTVTVPAFAQLDSRKLVRGAHDSGFNRAGTTSPGGQVTWRLEIRNIGNVSVDEVHYVDTFPHVGDTGVRRVDQQRGSQYSPYLVGLVQAPAGWEVEYSLSETPCRPEVLGPNNLGVNCEAPNWTTTPDLAQLSNYRSIRLRYLDGALDVGAPTVTFEFNMVAPVVDPAYEDGGHHYGALLECSIPLSDPAYDPVTQTGGPGASLLDNDQSAEPTCPMASNSFAYGVRVPSDQLNGLPDPGILAAEPRKVDLHVTASDDDLGNGIGDRVWYDRNLDGIQDPGEEGVPGVRVELYRVVNGSREHVDTTFTDATGRYLFLSDPLDLPDGQYVVRFYPPPNHDVSPQNQGSDPAVDSDVPRTPTEPGGAVPPSTTGGAFHETQVVTLSGGVVDLTWDMGIWGGFDPAISVDKVTKDSALPDSEAGDGVEIVEGRPVTWIYTVTNTGDARLEDVVLVDDGGPEPSFTVTECAIVDDGVNLDGLASSATEPMALNRGAVMRCVAHGTAVLGLYENVADVVGTPTLEDGSSPPDDVPDEVDDSDPSSYHGIGETTYAVGDHVWFDLNGNGIQDPWEEGVEGVTVELLHADGTPVLDGDGEPRVTVTDEHGRYVFDEVPAGNYRIRFSDLPPGYFFTSQHQGGDETVDSNSDNAGLTPVFELGLLNDNVRPVVPGDEVDEPLVAPLIDPTIDAGIRPRILPPPTTTTTSTTSTTVPDSDGPDGEGTGGAGSGDRPGVGGGGTGTGSLPRTGLDVAALLFAAASVTALGALLLVSASRRRVSPRP